VIYGMTKGYRHHPQLQRFQAQSAPRSAINAYLREVVAEADARGYSFDRSKLDPVRGRIGLVATRGQVEYEWEHLMRKLATRNPDVHARWKRVAVPEVHPLFTLVDGPMEDWERPKGA
jgi:hypothetical protein